MKPFKKQDSLGSPGDLEKRMKLLTDQVEYQKKHLDKIWETLAEYRERLDDLEIHINFTSRLLTHLCMSKLGISQEALRQMIQQIQQETMEDSQIMMLEEWFENPTPNDPDKPRQAPDEEEPPAQKAS